MSHPQGDRIRSLLIVAVIAYGVTNAFLYCSLLPLWEGFDEAFHYGYVQELAVGRTLPVLGKASLSDEVWSSMQLAPVSHVVRRSYPNLTAFDEFFALPSAVQAQRRDQLYRLNPALRNTHSGTPSNYEVHQAPLAYAVLAIPDALWSGAPLTTRIWRLRLFGAIFACLTISAAALYLARGLGLRRIDEPVLLFLLFSTQMFYATVCHVANDWLSVPSAVGLFGAAVRFHQAPSSRNAFVLSAMLALGLIEKAYFLAFVPAVLALVLWQAWAQPRLTFQAALAFVLVPALSGTWYARNLLLYGSLSGTVESINGVGARAVAAVLPQISWPRTIGYVARGSLWTGNNTFSSFSQTTLDAMLLVSFAGIIALLVATRLKALSPSERIVLAGILFFSVALAYVTAQQYIFTKGASAGASVWYTQPLLVPMTVLVLAGFERARALGSWLRAAMLLLWTYTICATYWVKLIPLYAGYGGEKATVPRLLNWYKQFPTDGREMLSNVALLPAETICALAGVVTIAAVILCGLLLYLTPLFSRAGRNSSPARQVGSAS